MLQWLSKVAGGRVAVYVPDHPAANNRGYVLRSRLVVEKRLGRYLLSSEEVHHKNEDSTDDSDDNLEVKTTTDHARHHYLKRKKDGTLKFGVRKMDYGPILALMKQGLGYKRIAASINQPVYAVRYACRVLKRGGEL